MRRLILASWWPTPNLPYNGLVLQRRAHSWAKEAIVLVPELGSMRQRRSWVWPGWQQQGLLHTLNGPRPIGRAGLVFQAHFLRQHLKKLGRFDQVLILSGVAAQGIETMPGFSDTEIILEEHHSGISRGQMPEPFKSWYQNLAKQARQRLALSPSQAGDLSRHYGGNWLVKAPKLDPCFNKQGPRAENQRDLLFVGNFKHGKGLNNLTAALDQIPQRQVTFIGQGRLESKLRWWAGHSQHDIQILQPGPSQDIRNAMLAHKILVQPSEYETYSLVVREALACGMQVISTRCGGPESATGRIEFVDAQNPKALAFALIQASGLASGLASGQA